MTDYLFPPAPQPALAICGETALYPINRIFCVGRNYAEHAAEMGAEIPDAPFYFTKSATHVAHSGATLPYPPGTGDYHHEMELAFAVGKSVFRAGAEEASGAILAYGCALDMTRRDLQATAKAKRRPWDVSKDSEGGCILAAMTRAADVPDIEKAAISLLVNGEKRQSGKIEDMIHSCPAILADLSNFYHLTPGDIILTGTPAGVGPVHPGDHLTGTISGLTPVELTVAQAE